MQTIKNWLNQLKKRFYRWLGKRKLIKRYEFQNEVSILMEEFITSKILEGGSAEFLAKGRENLIKQQAEIRETAKLIEFLKKTK